MSRAIFSGMLVVGASLVALALTGTGCGAPQEPPPAEAMSAVEHEKVARAHEREARAHDDAARAGAARRIEDRYQCIDQPLADTPYSGGQPIQVMRPCWTIEQSPSTDEAREAEAHRREAARHRRIAATLVQVERDACQGMGEDEISHSPFYHRGDVARVDPVRRGRDIVGARVLFKKVHGLDVQWMKRAAACHNARAAVMGYASTFQPYDPLAVEDAVFEVEQTEGGIAVTITSPNPVSAATIYGRAQALLDDGPDAAPRAAR